jgi:hypothetical protein
VIEGTKRCRNHAGKATEVARAEGAIRIEASRWSLDSHDGTDIDPKVEILRMITFWKCRANMYGGLLGQAYDAAERLQRTVQAESIVELTLAEPECEIRDDKGTVLHEHPALQTARQDLQRVFAMGGVTALVGHKYDVDRDGRIFAVDEGIRALVTLEERAHDMLGKMCKLAISAKVAESRIQLAETTGFMIQAVIVGVLRDSGVTVNEARVHDLIVHHIDQVVGGGGPLGIAA